MSGPLTDGTESVTEREVSESLTTANERSYPPGLGIFAAAIPNPGAPGLGVERVRLPAGKLRERTDHE